MNKKIVLVEDDVALRKALTEWLKSEGYEMAALSSGEQALEVIPKTLPDLILMDLLLPRTSGLDVMKRLKQNPETARIPMVVLTNLGDEPSRKRALAAGAVDYLIKAEHDLHSVSRTVNKALGAKQ